MPARFLSLDDVPAVTDDVRGFVFEVEDDLWLPIAIARWADAVVVELDHPAWAKRFPAANRALHDVGPMYHALFC